MINHKKVYFYQNLITIDTHWFLTHLCILLRKAFWLPFIRRYGFVTKQCALVEKRLRWGGPSLWLSLRISASSLRRVLKVWYRRIERKEGSRVERKSNLFVSIDRRLRFHLALHLLPFFIFSLNLKHLTFSQLKLGHFSNFLPHTSQLLISSSKLFLILFLLWKPRGTSSDMFRCLGNLLLSSILSFQTSSMIIHNCLSSKGDANTSWEL